MNMGIAGSATAPGGQRASSMTMSYILNARSMPVLEMRSGSKTQSRAASIINEISSAYSAAGNYNAATTTTSTTYSPRSRGGSSVGDTSTPKRFHNPASNQLGFISAPPGSVRSSVASVFSAEMITTPPTPTATTTIKRRGKKQQRKNPVTTVSPPSPSSTFSSSFSTGSQGQDLFKMVDPYSVHTSSADVPVFSQNPNSKVLTSTAYPNGVLGFIPYSGPNHAAVSTSSAIGPASYETSGVDAMMAGFPQVIMTPGSSPAAYNASVSASFTNFTVASSSGTGLQTLTNPEKTRRPRQSNPYNLDKSGTPWTKEDIAILGVGKQRGKKWADIAAGLERSDESARGYWKNQRKNITIDDEAVLAHATQYWNSVS